MTIWPTAETQHGWFTRRQWAALGGSERSLRSAIERGEVLRTRNGLYRAAGAPLTWEARVHGAVLSAGSTALAGHRTAAALWSLPGFPRVPVEVTRRRGRHRPDPSSGTVRETLDLPSCDFATVLGIPVTSACRTVIDLARVVHPARLDRLVDAALARRLVDLEDLRQRAEQLAARGRKGTVAMRAALDRRQPGHVALESELEAELFDLLDGSGLPLPTRQRWVGGTHAAVGRVDFVYLNARLVVEADGRAHHSALSDWEADRERDLRLLAAGYRVVRVTWWQVKNQPELVLAAIRAALSFSATFSVA